MLLSEHKNSKKQGDAGLGSAISYFASEGFTVCIPLTDSNDYDLIIDTGELKRVQVKTTWHKENNKSYKVDLRTTGGNQSFNTAKLFDNKKVDYVYILVLNGDRYLIPTDEIENKSAINLGLKYEKYKLG